jgi:hypothetical protein
VLISKRLLLHERRPAHRVVRGVDRANAQQAL